MRAATDAERDLVSKVDLELTWCRAGLGDWPTLVPLMLELEPIATRPEPERPPDKVKIRSHSDPKVEYTLTLRSDGGYACECKGYEFSRSVPKSCRHTREASER